MSNETDRQTAPVTADAGSGTGTQGLSRAQQLQRLERGTHMELARLAAGERIGVAAEDWLVTSIHWDLAVSG